MRVFFFYQCMIRQFRLTEYIFLFLDYVCGQSLNVSVNPVPVGSNVTLYGPASINTGAWLFDNNIIVLIFPGNHIISNEWRRRVIFNSSMSSLTIKSVQLNYSGEYALEEVNSFDAQLTLSVQGEDQLITFHFYNLKYFLTLYKYLFKIKCNLYKKVETFKRQPLADNMLCTSMFAVGYFHALICKTKPQSTMGAYYGPWQLADQISFYWVS